MSPNEYQGRALAFASKDGKTLACAALGLCGESGEFADMVKKWLYQGHGFDDAKAIEELGDVLWYVALACSLMGTTMNRVMAANLAKLQRRFPSGHFEAANSINRDAEKDVEK